MSELSGGFVRYIGEAEYLGYHEDVGPDREGNVRKTIVFELQFNHSSSTVVAADLRFKEPKTPSNYWKTPLSELRSKCLEKQSKSTLPKDRREAVYERSQAVRIYALRRANGKCEGCESEAPFIGQDGRPFLEVHHICRLADKGPDHPRWVVALCPNCHRYVHFGRDGDKFNQVLATKATRLEPN